MLLLIPMLKVLHRRYRRPCELVSSGRWTVPLMQRVPACGPVTLLTSRRAPYWLNRSQQELVAALRQRPAGPVYIYEPDEKSHFLLRHGGVSPDWICSLRDFPRRPEESIQNHAMRLARETPLALRNSDAFPVDPSYAPDARPAMSEADQRDYEDWVRARNLDAAPLVLLQPGNKKTMRRGRRTRRSNIDYWPEHHWARVIEGVRQRMPTAHVLICGSPEERDLADDIVSQDALASAAEIPMLMNPNIVENFRKSDVD